LCDWDTLEYCSSSTGVGTMYWWKTFDLSHLTEKHHITRYEPLLNAANAKVSDGSLGGGVEEDEHTSHTKN